MTGCSETLLQEAVFAVHCAAAPFTSVQLKEMCTCCYIEFSSAGDKESVCVRGGGLTDIKLMVQ